jgi:hypothetical protein
VLTGLIICTALVSHFALFGTRLEAHTSSMQAPIISPVLPTSATPAASANLYLYFVLKQPSGFVLARTPEGVSNQPIGAPQVVTAFDDDFGQSIADTIVSLQTSPNERYVAIDGTHNDDGLLWIFDTQHLVLSREPADVSGAFLHWLPGAGGLFLYRPLVRLGPAAPLSGGKWDPGLWLGDATTDDFTNIDINVPSTDLLDAIGSPDDSQIIYSTTKGLGLGSDIWTVDLDGLHSEHLLNLAGSVDDIADMFDWSPDGQSIAYERLADSLTPFLSADLWVMDRQGGNQRFLVQADVEHGFTVRWSPDSTKIAYVTRTNSAASQADQGSQVLQSAVNVVDVSSRHSWSIASPQVTGVRINANPAWRANSKQITFAAFNSLNSEFGGSVRYWSVQVNSGSVHPSAVQISQSITHVVALA